jgi:hypothetical protein
MDGQRHNASLVMPTNRKKERVIMFYDSNGSCCGCVFDISSSEVCLNCFNYGSWASPDEIDKIESDE